jgi:hypothetical protein
LELNKDSLLAGICFGLAYLVRPEAIAYPFLASLAILVVAVTEKKDLKTALLACGMVLGSFALLAAPYVWFLSVRTGHFRVEGKKNINLTISQRMNRGQSYLQAAYGIGPDFEEEGPLLNPNRFVGKPPAMSARTFANYFLEAAKRNKGVLYKEVLPSYGFGPVLMTMVVLGLFGSPWNAKRFLSEGYLLLMVSFFLLLMLSLHIFLYRYAFPLLPFLLLWAAKGIDELSKWIVATARLIKCRVLPNPARVGTTARWAVSVILLILAFAGLRDVGEFEQAKPRFRPVKEAGLWLRSYRSGPKRIMNTNDTIPFYAEGLELEFPYCDSPLALAYIRRKNPDFIVLNAMHGVRSRPYMEDWIKSGIPDGHAQLVYQTGESLEEKILIYHWKGEPISQTERPEGAHASHSQGRVL